MNTVRRWDFSNFLIPVAASFGLLVSGGVVAQDGEADNTASGALEEVTVTARKRVENIQDVALSVSAMGQREIANNFATDLRELTYISANTVIDDTAQGPGGVAAAYIRGVGVSEVEKNFDPAVGVVVDGIFRGTATGSIERAIDLQRVEVLRGPQGTLFGRNTIGGVIILERTKPTGKLGGKLRASYGSYETTIVDGVFNFAVGEQLAVKLTGSYRDQSKGFYTNLNTGRRDGQLEYKSVGINPLWKPTENLEIEYTYLRERTDQDTPTLLNVGQPGQLFCDAFGFCSPDIRTPVSGDRFDSLSDLVGPDDATYDADTNELEVRWDINDDYRIDYVFGRWETDETILTDWDGLPPILFHTDRPSQYDQQTHELRLTYDAGGALAYTIGAYRWDSDYEVGLISIIGFAGTPEPLELPQTTKQDSESWALFFEGDYAFNEQWTLTLGARYTEDDKETDQAGVVTATAEASWDEFTPKVALKYQLNDDSMIYGLFSAGYRSGGFNGRVDSLETATTPYDPETLDNFELGYKSSWLNNRLTFNATVFYMDYKDKQEEIQQPSATSGTGQVTRVVNAATATISGAEFEVMFAATDQLTIRANLGLLDARYDDFLVDIGTPDNPNIVDFSDLDFRRAPDVTASVSGSYEWQAGPGMAWVRAGWRFIGSHEVDFANKPEFHNSAQHLVDASLNYQYQQWQFSLYGRNLLDEDEYGIGFDVAGLWSYAAPRPPQTFGFEVGYTFGD